MLNGANERKQWLDDIWLGSLRQALVGHSLSLRAAEFVLLLAATADCSVKLGSWMAELCVVERHPTRPAIIKQKQAAQ